MPSGPNVVDWATLAVAAVGTSLTTFTTVWVASRADQEKFVLHIDWGWDPGGPIAEYPVLYVQNRSSIPILIAEVAWYQGLFWRRRSTVTAKWWEDPSDLNFPYEIEPGKLHSFALEENGAERELGKATLLAKKLGWIRRGTFWIGVTTAAGKRKFIRGDDALPWKLRPPWLKISND